MAIDYQQIYNKIKEIGVGARKRRERIENLRKHARGMLVSYANELDYLHELVNRVRESDLNVRCALPVSESLVTHIPTPALTSNATLIAADGSQISPDRHSAVQFCLINVGAIMMHMQSGQAPQIDTSSELLYGDELETEYGLMSEGMVALKRDLSERRKLENLSKEIKGPVVTFTDGPIELWAAKDGQDAKAYYEALKNYLSVLSRLQERGVITAGYVDKPAADLVVRLLELIDSKPEELKTPRKINRWHGVTDRWLFGEKNNPLLGPGERSAIFSIQSKSEKDYQGALGLNFFYLNVGTKRHPWPVRVEIPKWVADEREKLDLLHAVLVEQCRVMGSKPYPYLLHRAHEVAIVRHDEKYQVEQMLAQELHLQGEELDEESAKQSAKNLVGRTRM